jgi:hypothetical protein
MAPIYNKGTVDFEQWLEQFDSEYPGCEYVYNYMLFCYNEGMDIDEVYNELKAA